MSTRTALGNISRGIVEYADAVIALLLAIVVGVLGLCGVASEAVTSAGILTTLAVLAVGVLRDRVNKISLDREVRRSTDQSREVIATLPARLASIDSLADSVSALKGIAEDAAMVRTLRGSEVEAALESARQQTDRWIFKGGTGTYLRAVTLPECVAATIKKRHSALEFRIEIIDPTNADACHRYENFRRSVSQNTGDSWLAGRARLESYATIVAACWYRRHFATLVIRVGLTSTVSTFRYDMTSEYLIVTQDDARIPALLVSRDKPLYRSYNLELQTSFEQAREVDLSSANKVELSDEPTPAEVVTLLDELNLRPDPSLSESELDLLIQKAVHAENPYGR